MLIDHTGAIILSHIAPMNTNTIAGSTIIFCRFSRCASVSGSRSMINFDDPRRSHRCNPIHPDFMEDITDAYESAYTIMLNLNKTWV